MIYWRFYAPDKCHSGCFPLKFPLWEFSRHQYLLEAMFKAGYFLQLLLGYQKNALNVLSVSQHVVYITFEHVTFREKSFSVLIWQFSASQGQCTSQGRWSSVKHTVAFHSRQKWKINVHHVISAMPSDTRGFYMIQNAYENCPCSILSPSNVPLDSDFPDTGTWYIDFHLSAFSVIIYGLML